MNKKASNPPPPLQHNRPKPPPMPPAHGTGASSKTVFVIEKQDNHGEFQPLDNASFKDRGEAISVMEGKKATRLSLAHTSRYRVMPYIRARSEA